MTSLRELLSAPRYEVIPAKGTEQAVADWVPAGMTVAITATRQASQPRMNARPFQMPFLALSTRMKAVSGNGSRVMPRPMSRRSSTTPGHRPCSAVIRPDFAASVRAW